MAEFNNDKKIKQAQFHSLSKVNERIDQFAYESTLKSSHNTYTKDIFTSNIPVCSTFTQADAFVSANPTVVKKYTNFTLAPKLGSNNQVWYILDFGDYVSHWIDPMDIISPTGEPSYGFRVRLYKQDETQIAPTQGSWEVDYYSGTILFNPGQTPNDLGWGNIRVTCYVNTGINLKSYLDNLPSGGGGTPVVEVNGIGVGELTLDTISKALGNSIQWDFNIYNGISIITGSIFASWIGGIRHSEIHTTYEGNFQNISFNVTEDVDEVNLLVNNSAGIWSFKARKIIL